MTDQTPEKPANVVLKCQRCGGDMPPLPDDLAAMARAAGGVSLAHDVCPGDDAPAAPEGRYFEVRVSVVEVTEETPADDSPTVTDLVSFRAGHRAPTLDEAMRPLALALGEKWARAEKQAKVADS